MAELAGMDAGEIFAFLKAVMAREFDIAPNEIRLESNFVEDLDMDSIDAVDLAVAVEEELGVQFETDDLTDLQAMRDVVDLIERKRAGMDG
jgi:acyl carrier protein